MRRIKLIVTLLVGYLVGLVLLAKPASAFSPAITQLPGYLNYTDFKLSCTPNGTATTAQFSSKKAGGSYTDFGSLIDLTVNPCLVQVTGAQFGSEGTFFFKVTLSDGSFAETSTTLNTTAPGNVTDFSKDRMNSGTTYRVHWKNPTDTDYKRVFVYRGTSAGFSADNDHKVAELGGNPGDTMTWDDNGLDPTKEYFYAIRALDRADNGSSLVGDAGATTTASAAPGQVLGTSTAGGKAVSLPKEKVLGGGTTEPSPTAASTVAGEPQGSEVGTATPLLGSTRNKVIAGVALLIVAYLAYTFFKKKD